MRFRPRFSLRTLFVFVAIAGIVTAWVLSTLDWIRQRREYLSQQIITSTDIMDHQAEARLVYEWKASCPWSLWIFGESALDFAWAPIGAEETVRRLFPESIVIRLDRNPLVWDFGKNTYVLSDKPYQQK